MRSILAPARRFPVFLVMALLAASLYVLSQMPAVGGGPASASAAPDDNGDPRERYGVQIVGDERHPRPLFEAARDLGVRWVRLAFDREFIQSGPQQYEWEYYDEMVSLAEAHDVRLLGMLGQSPTWGNVDVRSMSLYNFPPRHYDLWADYVFQTAWRYRDRVQYWEIWNEQDVPPPIGVWFGTPAEYARLLAVAHTEIRRANPAAQVLLGGFLAEPGVSVDFYNAILADPDYPAENYFDIMNIHAYFTRDQAREKVALWRSLTNKPLWVTEMAWPADPQIQEAGDPEFCCGEEAQARYLRTVMPELVELGADKIFWFALHVPENEWKESNTYGLLDEAFRPREAYFALRALLKGTPP